MSNVAATTNGTNGTAGWTLEDDPGREARAHLEGAIDDVGTAILEFSRLLYLTEMPQFLRPEDLAGLGKLLRSINCSLELVHAEPLLQERVAELEAYTRKVTKAARKAGAR